jgi:hypothetical protein
MRECPILRACDFAEWHTKFGVHLIAAGLTAATLLGQPSIAEAGVVIEQPKTKKVSMHA